MSFKILQASSTKPTDDPQMLKMGLSVPNISLLMPQMDIHTPKVYYLMPLVSFPMLQVSLLII